MCQDLSAVAANCRIQSYLHFWSAPKGGWLCQHAGDGGQDKGDGGGTLRETQNARSKGEAVKGIFLDKGASYDRVLVGRGKPEVGVSGHWKVLELYYFECRGKLLCGI